MTKITFLNHASFIIEYNNIKILNDPYLSGSAFNNGWNLLQEFDHKEYLEDITHICFSHEHPDHFSIPFLKSIDESKRTKITIIYQDTFDKRVKSFCQKLGYQFLEFENLIEKQIQENFSITIGKVPFYDSWINYKVNGKNILNVNDCVIENPSVANQIKKNIKKVHTLLTQFSYASYIPVNEQKEKALKCLENIKIQDEILKPNFIIPFASFIYFSNTQNKFMNKNINTIEKTYDYLTKNCNSNPIILAPNEIWDLQIKDNKKSLLFWKNIYDNLNNLNYYEEKNLYKLNELTDKSQKYIEKVYKKNNGLILKILYKLKILSPVNIFISDLNIYLNFSIIDGLTEISENKLNDNYVKMDSNSLAFIFDYEYGLDTLLVNARFETFKTYKNNLIKSFAIGALNNTGRFMRFRDLFKYLNINFIERTLKKLK